MARNHGREFMGEMVDNYLCLSRSNDVIFKNFMLERSHDYDSSGRIESEEESEEVRAELKGFLYGFGIEYTKYNGLEDILDSPNKSGAW